MFSSTGLQHQTGLSISCCCLFACAQGFIKPVSKKKCKISIFIECTKECVPIPRQKNKLHHASWMTMGTLKRNAVENVNQVLLRRGQTIYGVRSLIILRCESHTTRLKTTVCIDCLTSTQNLIYSHIVSVNINVRCSDKIYKGKSEVQCKL